ncbi:PREDICTED: S-adenosyl-L-methionine-dependent tRNA 4-demethylwyosine synthase-like [Priapulus caudatus]|uniref:S-adenosyl-L-methionine-dependent tRNA 4-demethylwyosine synthase-like n=1 Tax=Priapulus caudatus TaxID=37621 RepID=A0ABM1EBU1_PRICU|nr:PREDICTED: S-adenosyl-L-methionine-dependent tRNA 4-demethylwyosine synthase-like [Priapulus caudatus]
MLRGGGGCYKHAFSSCWCMCCYSRCCAVAAAATSTRSHRVGACVVTVDAARSRRLLQARVLIVLMRVLLQSMLRGGGGCYKHAFYGIESHRCMEATPSLACANKCVFCWRHHTNPVGTEWRWLMDEPEFILQGALDNHCKMIKEFRGVPGVLPGRLIEGATPQHCALSLVGEPIMYPRIRKFVQLLHSRHISTFLVTNAQFPDAIRSIDPVTQLYVSVDASSKETLKKVDRPLFRDFWQRFLDSLQALADKRQRTVFRLTIVKSWNADEIQGYADLVEIGKPEFIEIKATRSRVTAR